MALDAADHPQVRAGAVSALKRCGDAAVPDLIRPLVVGQGGLILRMTSKATPSTCSGPITSQRPSSSRC